MSRNPTPPITDGLVLAIIPAARSLLDWSGAGRDPTFAGAAGSNWIRQGGVWQFRAEGTGRLVVTNDPTLEAVTDFSLVVAGSWPSPPGGRVFNKRDAGGTHIDIYLDTGTKVEINNGVFARSASVGNWASVRSWAVTQVSGAIAALYTNGAWKSAFNGVSTITGDDADVTLLNTYVGNSPCLNSTRALLLYNRVLTADEISRNAQWSDSLSSPEISPNRRYFDRGSWVPNGSADGEVGAWDCGVITSRVCADKSGNGGHLPAVGNVAPIHTVIGRMAGIGGNGSYLGNVNVPGTGTEGTVLCSGMFNGAGGANQVIVGIGGTNDGLSLRFNAANQFSLWDDIDNANTELADTTVLAPGRVYRFAVTVAADGTKELFIDGVSVTSGVAGGGTWSDIGTKTVRVGGRVDGTWWLDGAVGPVEVRNQLMSDAELRADADRFNRIVLYYEDMSNALPTVTPVVAGQQIPGTEYTVESGTFDVVEGIVDGIIRKWIECATAGQFRRLNPFAYCTCDIEFSKLDTSTVRFDFISVTGGLPGAAYYIGLSNTEFLWLVENGVAVHFQTAAGYAPTGSVYRLRITRSSAGVFTSYIRGGAFEEWTLVAADTGANPFTDPTVTESSYYLFDYDAGDRHYLDAQYLGVVPPV